MELEQLDVQTDSSAVSEAAPEYKSPEQMTSSERENWLLKGEIPLAGASPAETTRTSDEETEVADASGVKPAPASQPDQQKQQPPQRPAKGAKQETPAQKRIRELLAENERLRAAQPPAESSVTRTAASPTAQPVTEQPKPADKPAAAAPVAEDPKPVRAHKPDGSQWKDWNEYEAAKDSWLIREGARQATKTIGEHKQAETAAQAEQQLKAQWADRCLQAEKDPDMPDFKTVAFQQGGVNVNQTTKAFLFTSEMGPKILYTLQKNPQVAAQLAQADPLTTARVLVTLENSLANPPKAGAASARPAAASTPRKPSQTPAPVVDIAGRNSAPANEEEAAVRNDDFRKFYELDTRKTIGNPR